MNIYVMCVYCACYRLQRFHYHTARLLKYRCICYVCNISCAQHFYVYVYTYYVYILCIFMGLIYLFLFVLRYLQCVAAIFSDVAV